VKTCTRDVTVNNEELVQFCNYADLDPDVQEYF